MALMDDLFSKAFGADQELDQLLRLRAFRHTHPEWVITHDGDMGVWRAFKRLRNGEDNVIRRELGELLDVLGKR